MKRERSLTNAIARAKRNLYKYGTVDAIIDAAIEHYLRKSDELPILVDAVNKYADKNGYKKTDLETVLRNF